jgi:glutaredoxin
VLFTKSYCPHSKKAKELFTSIEKSFLFIELDHATVCFYGVSSTHCHQAKFESHEAVGADVQAELKTISGISTVPQVFINGQTL